LTNLVIVFFTVNIIKSSL